MNKILSSLVCRQVARDIEQWFKDYGPRIEDPGSRATGGYRSRTVDGKQALDEDLS